MLWTLIENNTGTPNMSTVPFFYPVTWVEYFSGFCVLESQVTTLLLGGMLELHINTFKPLSFSVRFKNTLYQ